MIRCIVCKGETWERIICRECEEQQEYCTCEKEKER